MTDATSPDVPPPMPGEPAPGAALPWAPDGAIGFGWRMVKKDPSIIAVMLLAAVLGSVVSLVGQGVETAAILTNDRAGLGTAQTIHWFLAAVNFPIQAYFAMGTWRYLLKTARGEPASVGDLFGPGPYGSMLGAMLLCLVGVAVGLALCIVPGFILAVGTLLYPGLIMDRRLGAVESLKESWRLTTGHKGQIFVLMLFAFGVALAGWLACCVGIFVAIPIIQLAIAYLYLKLTGQRVVEPG